MKEFERWWKDLPDYSHYDYNLAKLAYKAALEMVLRKDNDHWNKICRDIINEELISE